MSGGGDRAKRQAKDAGVSVGGNGAKRQAKDDSHKGHKSPLKKIRASAESSLEKQRQSYFMDIAERTSRRSNDPITKVGACIVNPDDKIVGIGYNDLPNGCKAELWKRKKLYVCHAELNAVLNKNSADIKGCNIYTTLFPCNECAKVIIQSGIKHVYYHSDKKYGKAKTMASKEMLEMAGVGYSQIEGSPTESLSI